MWIWLVAGLILGFILIFANQSKTDASEKPRKQKAIGLQLREINDRYLEEFDEDDKLLEEFLIIDLLDEEEDEE
jgi:hypothetical protein